MTYRELIGQYEAGLLDDDEQKKVAADIERQEAISDYLYKKETIPELENLLEEAGSEQERGQEQGSDFVILVNRSIRRAFLRLGAVVLALSLALVLFLELVLPRAVSAFYYDPGREIGGDQNQMSLDMAVYTELFLPCRKRDHVLVNEKGYGCYDIDITQNVSFNGVMTTISGEITRGKLRLYNGDLLNRPAGNCFAWAQVFGDLSQPLSELEKEMNRTEGDVTIYSLMSAAGTPEQAKESAQGLIEGETYIGYVSLDQMMDYGEFVRWLDAQEVGASWCAVKTGDFEAWGDGEQAFHASNAGFSCDLMSSSFVWDEEKYPELIQWNVPPEAGDAQMAWEWNGGGRAVTEIGAAADTGDTAGIRAAADTGNAAEIGAAADTGDTAGIGAAADTGNAAEIGAAADTGDTAEIGAAADTGTPAKSDETREEYIYEQAQENSRSEAAMRTHFVSLLRYMADQKGFLALMGGAANLGNGLSVDAKADARADAFREAADYVEENGLTVYGFASVMDKETVLRLMELPEVYVIYTEKY